MENNNSNKTEGKSRKKKVGQDKPDRLWFLAARPSYLEGWTTGRLG